jgi:hypothetical protein
MLRLKNLLLTLIFIATPVMAGEHAIQPLPSWNEGAARTAIVEFVAAVTDPASPDFVPVPERIAVFDNDGTLWGEQPVYYQLVFALDRLRAMAPEHPEWREQQPFKAALDGDMATLVAGGKEALLELLMASHAGMSTTEFAAIVKAWLATERHPATGRLYTEMVYQPMLELLDYMRDNDFKTFIVSGGGIEFVRVFSEEVYGIPPEQVVGSSIKTELQIIAGEPVLVRLPEVNFIDDKAGKPVGINQHIGRRPIAAFGNSDGDLQMLQWTTAGAGVRLGGILRHTDAEREYEYARESPIGRLDTALDQAESRGWHIIDMQRDWAQIYPSLPESP